MMKVEGELGNVIDIFASAALTGDTSIREVYGSR